MTDVTGAGAEAQDPTVATGDVSPEVDLEAEAQAEHDSLVKRVEKAQIELAAAEAALNAAGA